MLRQAAFILLASVCGATASGPGGSVSHMANLRVSLRPQPTDFHGARFPESELKTLNKLLKKCEILDDWESARKAGGWERWDSYTLTGKFTRGNEQFGRVEVLALMKPARQGSVPFVITNIVLLFSPKRVVCTRNPDFVTYVNGGFLQKLVSWNPKMEDGIFWYRRLGQIKPAKTAQPVNVRDSK